MSHTLNNDSPFIDEDCRPIAYTATALALATHTYPIQALQYVFSNESYMKGASSYDTADDIAAAIADDLDLPLFGQIGDLSEDSKLLGYLASLTTSIARARDGANLSLSEMNGIFAEQRIWETMACIGKAWVANGVQWMAEKLYRKLTR